MQGSVDTIFHAGPGQVYMSRSDDLLNDVGDGDWFKIAEAGPLNDTWWKLLGATEVLSLLFERPCLTVLADEFYNSRDNSTREVSSENGTPHANVSWLRSSVLYQLR
jgi:hypothetical protein